MRYFALLILCFALFIACTAQESNKYPGMGVEANVMTGKILRHSKKFPTIIPDHSTTFEINYLQQTFGKKDWHHRWNYPLIGFAASVTNYGIDSIYGKCISIYPNVEIPVIKRGNFQWTIKASFGLGYVTKRYSRYPSWDTINTAIGSHVNNYSLFATDLRYRINKNWDVQAGLNFSHVSNAAFRAPNLGINTYGAHVGVRYFPTGSTPERIQREYSTLKNRWLVQARAGLSGAEMGMADGPMFPIYLASLYASKRYMSKNKAYAGIDYSYHNNVYAFLRNNEIDVGRERAQSWKSAIFAGNEFLLGRVGIMLQLGFYIKQAAMSKDVMYQKLGGNYYIVQNEKGVLKELFASCMLKTHKADAELVEVGFGLGF